MRRQLKNVALQCQYYSGLYRLSSPRYSGIGTIFLMHKVVDLNSNVLAKQLTITTHFLARIISKLQQRADFVTIYDVHKRLIEGHHRAPRPFIALTFDDGFRDNLSLLLPVPRRYHVPATVYVPSGAPDRTLDAWPWRLDEAIRRLAEITLDVPGLPRRLSGQTWREKRTAFRMLTLYIHRDIPSNRHVAEMLLPKWQVSEEALIAEHFASWDELRELASDPLITIGAHGVTHASLRDLGEDDALAEITYGKERLTAQLGIPVDHFAYPYGQRSNCGPREAALVARAGFVTGATNIVGNIFAQHQEHLMLLPRIGLGGTQREDLFGSSGFFRGFDTVEPSLAPSGCHDRPRLTGGGEACVRTGAMPF